MNIWPLFDFREKEELIWCVLDRYKRHKNVDKKTIDTLIVESKKAYDFNAWINSASLKLSSPLRCD
jgi:hypothetical protein